jgi:MFS family permease
VTRLPSGFLLLLVVSTLGTLSSGAVAPVLPRFAESELGGSETLVGLVVAASPFCSLLGGLLAGPYVDRSGRRVVALAGLGVASLGAVLLIPAEDVALTLIARSINGVGIGIAATAVITWAVDQVPPGRRGRALSIFGMTVWIGLSAGPQVGQAMFDAGGYQAVWASIAAFEVAALLLALAGEDRHRPAPVHAHSTARNRPRLVPAGAVRPSTLIGMAAYGEGVITAFLVLQLIERGVHAGAGFGGAASVYTVFAASVLVCRILATRKLDDWRPEVVAGAAFGMEALGLTTIAVASSFAAGALGAAIMGAGFAVLFPSLALVATETSAEEERGAALGAFGSSFALGLALGSLIGGGVAAVGGYGAAHLSAAVVAAAAGLYLAARREARPGAVALAERAP